MVDTCAVTCTAYDQNGNPEVGATFRARLSGYDVYQGFVVPEEITATADDNGQCVLNLWPNQLGATETLYEITIVGESGARLRTTATVPNTASANLHEISELPAYEGKSEGQISLDAAVAAGFSATSSANDAAASAVTAGNAASNAVAAEASAVAAAEAADTSAQNVTGSVAGAVAAKDAAVVARNAAEVAETNAQASAAAASAAADAASASATAAGVSEAASANSATAAAASESNVAADAATATTQAGIATTQATASSASATAAQTAQTAAELAETGAETALASSLVAQTAAELAETNAETALSSALAAQTAAEIAETNAAASEAGVSADAATATTKASAASTSASNAAASETAAGTSESNAASSATAASTAATNAANSATTAQTAESATVVARDDFFTRYIGQYANNAAANASGYTISEGIFYWNSTDKNLLIHDGTGWNPAVLEAGDVLIPANNLSDLINTVTARSNLGLGTAATTAATDYATAAQGTNANTAFGWGNHATQGYLTDAGGGAAATADKLTTARNIALTGDVTGSTNFDGSGNVSITATIADDSHNHVISNVDGLQTALNGKLATGAKAADSNLLDGLDSTAFATNAQGTLANTALQPAAIGSTVQGYSAVLNATTASYTTAAASKLAGIEAGADVTDTTNVTAAGALMDSEVTNLAAVKAFNPSAYLGATAKAADSSLLDGLDSTQFLRSDQSDTFAGILTFEDATPLLSFTETDAAADNQRWNFGPSGGSFRLQALTDAGAGSGNYFQIDRSGNSITGFGLYGAGTLRTFLSTTARSVLFSGGAGSVGTDTAHSFSLKTNNTDRLTIDSSGDIAVPGTVDVGGDLTSTSSVTAPTYKTDQTQRRIKYSVWDDDSTYGIGFDNAYSYGFLTDYTMTFQVNTTAGRGWWWGTNSDTKAQGAMSLTNDGKLHVDNSITIGSTSNTVATLAGTETFTNKTLTNPAITAPTITGTVIEDVYAVTGTTPALEPANGSIQTWTLTGNSTPTDSVATGEAITLMIEDGTAYTITWPTITWVNNGGAAPTLATTGYTVIALWKVSTTLYGALVGDGS